MELIRTENAVHCTAHPLLILIKFQQGFETSESKQEVNEALIAYNEVSSKYLQLEAACRKHFPKVDPKLIRDLLKYSKVQRIQIYLHWRFLQKKGLILKKLETTS